jgi:hypothetical protein
MISSFIPTLLETFWMTYVIYIDSTSASDWMLEHKRFAEISTIVTVCWNLDYGHCVLKTDCLNLLQNKIEQCVWLAVISRKAGSRLLEDAENGHEESTHHLHFPSTEGTHNCTRQVYPSDNQKPLGGNTVCIRHTDMRLEKFCRHTDMRLENTLIWGLKTYRYGLLRQYHVWTWKVCTDQETQPQDTDR